MKWSEADIQSLKAQEAKDLATQLLKKLNAKDQAPITAGQVQLKELQYELKIKEAAAEDNRQREAHELKIRELELRIEQERRLQAEADSNTDRVRQEYANMVEQVRSAQESLSSQLETASREHIVRTESLELEFGQKNELLKQEHERLESENARLVATIQQLTDLSEIALEIEELRGEIETRKVGQQRELDRLDELFESAEFEKNKKVSQIKRDQEVAVAELETEHKKRILQSNTEVAEKILAGAGMMGVLRSEWEGVQQELQQQREQDESQLAAMRKQLEDEFKRTYNITSAELIDVTDLYYRHQSLAQESTTLREQIGKLESEVSRMRQHIEQEPLRLAKAVEAAKVSIQNNIEAAGKR